MGTEMSLTAMWWRNYCCYEAYKFQALRVRTKKLIFLFLNQTYVVGTQKNRLNETILFSTQNIW